MDRSRSRFNSNDYSGWTTVIGQIRHLKGLPTILMLRQSA